MPSYAGESLVLDLHRGRLTLFQPRGSRGGSLHWRLKLDECPHRIDGSMKVKGLEVYDRMSKIETFPHWGSIREDLMKIVFAARERYRRSKEHSYRKTTVSAYVESYLLQLKKDYDGKLITESKLRNQSGFFTHYVQTFRKFETTEITDLTTELLEEWARHRDTYWTSGPGTSDERMKAHLGRLSKPLSLSSKHKHWQYMKMLFSYAKLAKKDIPDFDYRKSLSAQRRTRPAISRAEWEKIASGVALWIERGPSSVDKNYRRLTWYLALICRAYGLRVNEAYALRFEHVFQEEIDGHHVVVLSVPATGGKRKAHPREVDPLPFFQKQVEDVLLSDLPKLVELISGRAVQPSTPLFFKDSKNMASDFDKLFKKLLASVSLLKDASGAVRSLGSCRHSAITEWIERTPASLGLITKWAGTGLPMIEAHYNKALTRRGLAEARKILRKEAGLD